MIFDCEFWVVGEDNKKLKYSFKTKSTRRAKLIKIMREKFGNVVNFDSLKDFGYKIKKQQ